MDGLRLVRMRRDLEPAFREMEADYAAAGETMHSDVARNFDYYLEAWPRAEQGHVPKGYVPWTTFWLLDDDGRMLGGIRLRHELSRNLWQDGGNIGYDIRPSERGRGYATRMLAMVLEEARRRDMEWVLVTIHPDNVPSIRVAEKNGARFIGRARKSGMNRYRIDL